MTRKDYVLIAEALKLLRGDMQQCGPDVVRGVDAASRALAFELSRDNPRFDRERFLKAAGVQQ